MDVIFLMKSGSTYSHEKIPPVYNGGMCGCVINVCVQVCDKPGEDSIENSEPSKRTS